MTTTLVKGGGRYKGSGGSTMITVLVRGRGGYKGSGGGEMRNDLNNIVY
jgi:hypothetical protein